MNGLGEDEEIAQVAKYLMHKHESHSLIPDTHIKKPAMMVS